MLDGIQALAHKEKGGDMAPQRAKDDESGADFSRAQGKGILTPAAPRTVGGYHAGVPYLNS